MNQLVLSVLPQVLAVCRLEPAASLPNWAFRGDFLSITRTADELSVVCAEAFVPRDVRAERGWRAFKVEGPLDFALIGILAGLSGTLAQAGISLFAISTFDTDYLLVREPDFLSAILTLRQAGYTISGE